MRNVEAVEIEKMVEFLLIQASYKLPDDVKFALKRALSLETNQTAKEILNILLENAEIAGKGEFPLCQDTGMAFVFVEVGQEVYISHGSLKAAVFSGVEKAYRNGYLRKSVVMDPVRRKNTGTNLPPVLYTNLTDGDKIDITVMPKGFGAENQSRIKMMLPSASREELIRFVAEGVVASGSKGCPPAVIGVGMGGSFDGAACLAKKALLLPINKNNPDPYYREMEREILNQINASGIGPMGVGGKTTALSVRILTHPTHIAGLPVAYNYCCHSARHASATI